MNKLVYHVTGKAPIMKDVAKLLNVLDLGINGLYTDFAEKVIVTPAEGFNEDLFIEKLAEAYTKEGCLDVKVTKEMN